MSEKTGVWNSATLRGIRYHVREFWDDRFSMLGVNNPNNPTTKQNLYRIVCYIKGHCFCEEIMIDKNNTRNNCRCGQFMLFGWSHMSGYKSAMSTIAHLKRKRKWDKS